MEPLQGRMDFEFESLRQDLVNEIEAWSMSKWRLRATCAHSLLPREEAFQIPT